MTDNDGMKIRGHVKNGVVLLQDGAILPEGAPVTVLWDKARMRHKTSKNKRVKPPLVRSKQPGTLNLTNERIAEILQEEDVRAYSKFFPKSKRR